MGQKTHPIGFRLGISKNWNAGWFVARGADYAKLVADDIKIRRMVEEFYPDGAISSVEIDRDTKEVLIQFRTSRPGIVLGRSGGRVDQLRAQIQEITKSNTRISVLEIPVPELDAYQMGQSIAIQIEKRVNYRRALRKTVQRTMQAGAKGIKITVSGRLGGAEIARSDTNMEGSVPLHTLSADIDYAMVEANTTYGVIGVKVWINRGTVNLNEPSAIYVREREKPKSQMSGKRPRGERGDRDRNRGDRPDRGDNAPAASKAPATNSAPAADKAPTASSAPAAEKAPAPTAEKAPAAEKPPADNKPESSSK